MKPKAKQPKRKAHRPPQSEKIQWKPLLIVLVIGAALRVLYDLDLAGSIFWGNYLLDSQAYQTWALDILNGVKMNTPFFRAPLYPYTMAVLYYLFGISPWPVVIFQNVIGLATVLVTYRFAQRLMGSAPALWAAVVVAAYPTLIFYEGETLMTTLTVFLYLSAAYRIYRSVQSPGTLDFLTAGLVMGLAAITRPAILPLIIILPLALLLKWGWSARRKLVNPVLWALIGLALPIFPVTLANLANGGEFVLIATSGGVNFYIGNNTEADGITVIAPGPQSQLGKYRDNVWTSSTNEAERRAGKVLSQAEVSTFWFGEAMKEMAHEPLKAVRRLLKKFYLFWHGQEILNNRSLYDASDYSWFMRLTLWRFGLNFPTGLLFPLMFVGVYFARRDKLDMFFPLTYVLGLNVIIAAFFVCARFRQPVLPVAAILAVYGGAGFIRSFRDDRRRFWIGVTLFLVFAVCLNLGGNVESRLNRSVSEGFLGSGYHNRGDYTQAIEHYERALKLAPDNMQLYENLGKSYMKTEQYDKAKETFQAGLKLFPVYPQYNFNLGRIAQMNGDIDSAKYYFRATVEHAPDFAPGYDRLGYIYDQAGQYDSALYEYEQLYRLRPDNVRLLEKINDLKRLLGIDQ